MNDNKFLDSNAENVEETVGVDKEITSENSVEADVSTEDVTVPVTEADVLAAFTNAEKTLGDAQTTNEETVIEEETVPVEVSEEDDVVSGRDGYVKNFQMDFVVEDIHDSTEENSPIIEEQAPKATELVPLGETTPAAEEAEEDDEDHRPSRSGGCLIRIIFSMLIVLISIALATVITSAVLDITGFNRNNRKADVVIPEGASTEEIAAILKKEGMINHEYYFCLYVRFMDLGNKWQSGSFQLQADMGFPTLIKTMQAKAPSATVRVTFYEGDTVWEMAATLEENKVCDADDFISAVRYGDYDYDFIRDIPTEADDPIYANRPYRLEGYLFPDTYEFYIGSQGETVVNRMLQNFENKMTTDLLAQIEDSGWTLDQAITLASIIQGEADTMENMKKVSRVLYNRFDPASGFKKLQLCSTRDYVNDILDVDAGSFDPEALKQAYNTYFREGLPIGAINNPGMAALQAVLNPSDDPEAMEYFYFATDYEPDDGSDKPITYFSKTYEEHQAICKKYDIEDIG